MLVQASFDRIELNNVVITRVFLAYGVFGTLMILNVRLCSRTKLDEEGRRLSE